MLNVISKEEAVACVAGAAAKAKIKTETVSLPDAAGRIAAEDVRAAESLPPFDRSTVDGFAVVAADTFGSGDAIPAELTVAGECRMGELPPFSIGRGQCAAIPTGGMLPRGADAVVMVEHTERDGELCLVYAGVSPGANIVRQGDDISKGEAVVRKGTEIGVPEIAALAALGVYEIPVCKKPVVSVISTGDEIVTGTPRPGEMRDVNSFLLSALCGNMGCEAIRYGAVRDDREQIRAALESCLERSDLVLISGGSSAGTRDMTAEIIDSLGAVHFHGIAMKPGKPTIFGTAGGKLIFGLPGHPLAAYFVFRLIVSEAIRTMLGLPADQPFAKAPAAFNVPSNHGREEYLCVRRSETGEAVPLHTKSGLISVLSEADGFIRIARNTEGLKKGDTVELYRL